MSVNAKTDGIELHDLETLADNWAVPQWRRAISEVFDAVDR